MRPFISTSVRFFALLASCLGCCAVVGAADEVLTEPLAIRPVLAFPKLAWEGWSPVNDEGLLDQFRPVVLTHAGDGSNRIFVAEQRGRIYVFENDQGCENATVFLDIRDKVSYSDKTNEEGLLGLAFHPEYAKNGRFFVYYTDKSAPHKNVVAAYRARKDDPNRAGSESEEVLLTLDKPFWNHDGGTIVFGPDGYLYIAIGDGGSANDPHGNGQNLGTLLGKILRVDVNRRADDRPYAVPDDNPFVKRDGARGEIWAYGLRNVWRMAFDRSTGTLWAADVGQDTWEEIDLIARGGNYGWNVREGLHPFVKKGDKKPTDATKPDEMIDPIWEYKHDVGKSITGGMVYRGARLPQLNGAYLYADYIMPQLWALRYDADAKRVTANQTIPFPEKLPIMSFGEDQEGEAYLLTLAPGKHGIFQLETAEGSDTPSK